jgi:hypothetical protein
MGEEIRKVVGDSPLRHCVALIIPLLLVRILTEK